MHLALVTGDGVVDTGSTDHEVVVGMDESTTAEAGDYAVWMDHVLVDDCLGGRCLGMMAHSSCAQVP